MIYMSNKNIKGESKLWSIHFACQQLDQCVGDGILAIHDFLIPRQGYFLLAKVQL